MGMVKFDNNSNKSVKKLTKSLRPTNFSFLKILEWNKKGWISTFDSDNSTFFRFALTIIKPSPAHVQI